MLLRLGELEKLAAPTRPIETISYERTPDPAALRSVPAESFAHLPVKETVEIVPAAVPAEPEPYERIGEARTFEVDVVPPKLFKREIVRPKYRHRLDRNRAPLVAPTPARPVAGGYWRTTSRAASTTSAMSGCLLMCGRTPRCFTPSRLPNRSSGNAAVSSSP